MSQAQSLRKKNSADNSTQPLQRSGTKNNSEALDKKAGSAVQQDNAPLQKKAYRSALSSGQSAAQDEPRLQTKLSVSTPGDSHEQEADRVADEVVSRSAAAQSTEENKLNPGSTKPENNASNPQSLQTKISRMAEPAPAATEAPQTETESSPAETATDNEQGVSAEVEQQIAGLRGQGAQLPEHVRTEMESQFNHDFSSVSIHNDSTADTLCKQLSARAFTVGSDIFFASGEYAPDSQEGKRLLAHELTHVVQQGSGVTRKIMRVNTPAHIPTSGPGGGAINPANEFTLSDGTYIEREQRTYPGSTTPKKRISMPAVSLPNFKARNERRFPNVLAVRCGPRNASDQDVHWKNAVRSANSRIMETKKEAARVSGGYDSDSGTYFFKSTRNNNFVLFGNEEQLLESVMLPFWDESGQSSAYQIDHIIEDQLVNPEDPSISELDSSDKAANYELLDATANSSSGPKIAAQINRRRRAAIELFAREHPSEPPLTLDGLTHGYFNTFISRTFDLGSVGGRPQNFWSFRQINQGEHLNQLVGMTGRDLRRLNREDQPVIFSSSQGGRPFYIRTSQLPIENWLPRVDLKSIEMTPNAGEGTAGWITVDAYKAAEAEAGFINSSYQDVRWRLKSVPGMYGGAIDKESIAGNMRNSLRLPGLSPIELSTVDISDRGIVAEGRVLPTVPMVSDADVRIRITGDDVQLRKTFSSGEINIPSPFHISDTSLTVFFGARNGLGIEGALNFGIDRVGEGSITADVSAERGFALAGEFNFDDRIFGEGANARVRVGYADDQWSMGGTITIPEGKVPGIRTATINVDYSQGAGFSATGTASLNVPGVESGTIEITHNEEEGFVIGGSFNLSQGRGIRGGQISARVQERPDGTGYAVTAHGEAQPDIPGINSNLIVDYNDGAFTAEVSADYSRGMLSGQIHAGVTNRTVNDDGTLAETASENNELVVFGDGELTIQIAPWLQGTAGVRFAPNGEITVIGRIGLPDELEIFARREINRSIFSIAVQAPIFPGIVAEVGGGLSATAGIGPGVIDQLTLQIEYNPAHEEDTHITGDAHLNIPANAGLRLSVRAGIGLGITGASATGGLDIGGTLGIEGAAEAGVHVDWTPATGLDISAVLGVHAQPSFTFDIGGYVSVRALGFEVYDNRWEFASYTFGSDYRFGIRLPIHYREGEPFDISTDDIEFEVPDIDTNQLLRGLIERIA
ncbi:MAG: DUF4157 domain-containing protein [Cellvibrio sp.]|uniref:eCIS core domain-containing protein n=1 Tax=Cellvibrio sp. TaxID=1965322 RepID=UPI0027249E76|nr:DUF4157 domain-containing protein [Cellvibrio sp.]